MTSRLKAVMMTGVATAIVSATAAHAQPMLTIAIPGANWGEAFETCVVKPISEAAGFSYRVELGNSTTSFSKLQQQRDNPVIDVAWMDGGISEMAQAAGVVEALDPARVPNLANLLPQAVAKKDGNHFAASVGFYSLGIVYNTETVQTTPTSWNDLWSSDYEDEVIIPAPANAAGIPFILFLDKIWNTESDLAATFAKLKELRASMYFDTSGTASNAFQSGEAIIGANFNVSAWELADKGLPVAFAVPKEGFWANDGRIHLVKGSKNQELSEMLINYALTPEASTCLADKLYLGPAIAGVAVSPETAKKMPWGADGSIDSLVQIDWEFINAQRASIVEIWNREIAR
jgi:putative spermidine/putrescine transport system substrate-binding protein